MELGSIFLILAVFIIVGMYLYLPFTVRARRISNVDMHEISALKAGRDRVINSLQELDFDFKLGKVPAEDYPEQRAELLKKGAEILRKLDELEPRVSSARNAESRIETAAAAKRADASSSAAEISDDDLEAMIAARRKQHKSKPAGFCPSCGKPVLAADQFCPSCGKSLK
ncbi:MAG: zinc ribbon domain-containing protein [Anaerolineales bacterium]|nr:zinc ribbon domain-containing protein [Anaerolineales bacterium]MCB9146256.1 zinc ribbon domain-containing protein [Anaerolineales bacterium]